MSEVSTQPTAPTAVVPPAGEAAPVSVAPPDNSTTPNTTNTTPTATQETPVPGTGSGVDLDKITDSHQLTELLESMNLTPEGPAEGTVAAPATATIPAVATPASPAAEATPAAPPVETSLTRPGELPRNIKVPIRDEVDLHVQTFIKDARLAGTPLSYAEAERLANEKLGRPALPAAAAPSQAAPAVEAAPAAPVASDGPQMSADLTAAYADYQKARNDFDPAAEVAALQKINSIHAVENAKAAAAQVHQDVEAQRQQQTAAQIFENQWTDSVASATRLFADAGNPDSALSQRAAEIQETYQRSEDPAMQAIYRSATSPLLFMQMAAGELGVLPSAAPAAAAPVVTSPTLSTSAPQPVPGRQPPMAALLSGGNTGNTATAPPGLNLSHINNSNDLDVAIEANAHLLVGV